eukprot:jgi/Chrzof1/7098/Cz02g10220.t1
MMVKVAQFTFNGVSYVMEMCCLSRSGDSVSSALCCGVCLSVGTPVGLGLDSITDWDKSLPLYPHDTMASVVLVKSGAKQLCPHIVNLDPTTDSYYHKVTDTCHAPIF